MGELDQCKAMAEIVKGSNQDIFILQSVFSSSVPEKSLYHPSIDVGFYLPPDFPGEYDAIFQKYSPKVLVIAAWDIWPNLIFSAKKFGCNLFLACGSLHEGSGRIKNRFLKKLTTEVLQQFDGISPSSLSRESLFKKYAPGVVIHTCGDSRFDSVCEKVEKSISGNKSNLKFHENEKIFIFASTYTICEKMFFPKIGKILDFGYKIWIFPHKISEDRLTQLELELDKNSISHSRYSNSIEKDVLIFDVYGLLAFAFERARLCYVGGGFTHRIHNVIEPAYFGIPLSSGGKIQHSPEAMDLNSKGYLTVLNEGVDILKFIERYEDEKVLEDQRNEIQKFVKVNRGASLRFYETFLRKSLE